MTTLLIEHGQVEVTPGPGSEAQLWLSAEDFKAASGWTLKPEGLCRDEICVPVPNDDAEDYVADGFINLAAFWRRMNKPLARSRSGDAWSFGEGAGNRAESLQSLQAPDFSLPDIDGKAHHLSDYRGKKVFLVSFASW